MNTIESNIKDNETLDISGKVHSTFDDIESSCGLLFCAQQNHTFFNFFLS
jgi:hypothetical protein